MVYAYLAESHLVRQVDVAPRAGDEALQRRLQQQLVVT